MNVSVYLCLITAKARWECLCACLRHVRPNCFRRRHVRMNNLKALTPFFLRLLPPSSTPGWRRRRASTTWSKPTWGTRSCWRMLCRTSRLKGSPTTQKALSLLLGSSLRWDKKVFSFGERKKCLFFFYSEGKRGSEQVLNECCLWWLHVSTSSSSSSSRALSFTAICWSKVLPRLNCPDCYRWMTALKWKASSSSWVIVQQRLTWYMWWTLNFVKICGRIRYE